MAEPDAQTEYTDLVALAHEQELPYPLVALNGTLALAGNAHYYAVLPVVDQWLQAQKGG